MLTGGPAGTCDVARLLATERIYTGHNVINYITLADEAADGQNGNKTIDKSKHMHMHIELEQILVLILNHIQFAVDQIYASLFL